MNNPVAFSTFTMLCKHMQVQNVFIPKGNQYSPLPSVPGDDPSAVSMKLPVLVISFKWSHAQLAWLSD